MFKRRLLLVFMIAAMSMSGIASAQGSNWGGGGRVAVSKSGKTDIARLLTQCRAQPKVSFVIKSRC